jgi:predicted NUDIX family NTP pyrophosphohydrolase
MRKLSAGILPYRRRAGRIEVLLVHPGGPFWASRDAGAWSIAKGEYAESDPAFDAARREFAEETGHVLAGPFDQLTTIRQAGGKVVSVWTTEEDRWDARDCVSNTFSMEWPKGSGRMQTFPEADRVEWFDIDLATKKILPSQVPLLEELHQRLTGKPLDRNSPGSA